MEHADGLVAPHIAIREGVRGGRPHIHGRGFAVDYVAELHLDAGWPIHRICYQFDLTPAEVHAALAYYYDNMELLLARRHEDLRAIQEEVARAGPSRIDRARRSATGTTDLAGR